MAGVIAMLLGACSATDILNATASVADIEIMRDIPYGEGPRRTLDVYAPKNAANAPVAIFYYGGGWEGGSKNSYEFVAAALAKRGIVTIVPDYRVYPEVKYPDFLVDSAAAARWSKDNAARYGGDANRVFLTGHSAGAYNAAMLAVDKRWLNTVGLEPKRDFAGFVGIAGPYDFEATSEVLTTIFSTEAQWKDTQPVTYVEGNTPPARLIVGMLDTVVDPRNTTRLADRITATGGEVEIVTYRWVGHMLIIGAVAAPLRLFASTLDDTVAFIHATAKR